MQIINAYADKLSGMKLIYLQQSYQGVPVYNSLQIIALKDDAVQSVTGGIDDVINGIPVETWRNQPNHPAYTNIIYDKLEFFLSYNPTADPTSCYNKLLSIINEAKQAIVNNPTLKINELNF